ncbi:MAG: DUF4231 domain-containing protein [Plectolyngbya sp. WJT66-NPBG17]|jgi:hypothetical protein|nr:DUF4231 domain-containing protein [Plectolyngbya sp. WJT66-NPBG17]
MSAGDREVPLAPVASSSPALGKSNKKEKFNYNKQLQQDFGRLIDQLKLTDFQKEFMKARWLDQILWMEGRAVTSRKWYRLLRGVTIVGGVLLPAFLTLNFNQQLNTQPPNTQPPNTQPPNTQPLNTQQTNNQQGWFWVTFCLSQTVAVCAAMEQFYNNGERWRNYRRSAESLKTQGWQFFELSGPYATAKEHKDAFSLFVRNIEEVIQRDVEVYATQAFQEKKEDKPNPEKS